MNYTHIQKKGKNIFVIDMKKEKDKFFSQLVFKWIQKYLKQNKKILILANKKGYSSGLICQDCWFIPRCKKCDVSISYHKDQAGNFFGLCHICKAHYEYPLTCPNCWWANLKFFGSWTQQIQEFLQDKFNIPALIIESQQANSPKKIQKIKDQLPSYQIVIATSLLTFPPSNRKPDLVIVFNADVGLNVPDFNANYNNFLFLYETIQNYSPNAFLIQTFNPDAYSIKYATNIDFEWFKKQELTYRKQFSYPPFAQLAVLLYKNEIEEKLFNKVNKIYQDLEYLNEKLDFGLEIFPTPPLVYKMFGKYRYNIILKGKNVEEFLHQVKKHINFQKEGFQVDVMPLNLV